MTYNVPIVCVCVCVCVAIYSIVLSRDFCFCCESLSSYNSIKSVNFFCLYSANNFELSFVILISLFITLKVYNGLVQVGSKYILDPSFQQSVGSSNPNLFSRNIFSSTNIGFI